MTRMITMGQGEAERYMPGPNECCVSITSPGCEEATLHGSFAEVHRVSFYDAQSSDWTKQDGIFTPRQAKGIVEFVERNAHRARCVIHCTVGASRSVSVAMALEAEGLAVYDKPSWWGKLASGDDPANGFIPNESVYDRVVDVIEQLRRRQGAA